MSWMAGPRYLLRRCCILDVVAKIKPQRVLEIGCGAGDISQRLAAQGCNVVGVDLSEAAREQASERTQAFRDQVSIVADLPTEKESFDLVVAFEVLEHIDDDRGALREWSQQVAPGGRIMISVPCHQRRWGPCDDWAGHFRRYERDELTEKLAEVGFQIELLWCYGVPLANMVRPIRDWVSVRKMNAEGDMTIEKRTARSGIDQRWYENMLSALVSGPLILPFHWLQKLFLNTELGTGYLVLAKLT